MKKYLSALILQAALITVCAFTVNAQIAFMIL